MGLEGWLDRQYAGVLQNWDDRYFQEFVAREVKGGDVILDLGAGAGILDFFDFRGSDRFVVGIDTNWCIHSNEHVDSRILYSGGTIPLHDNSIDVVICNNVFEHVGNATIFLAEIYRVLKPGGKLFFKTPNKFHYVALIAKVVPQKFHHVLVFDTHRSSDDFFPTFYRLNSLKELKRLSQVIGFKKTTIDLVEGRPEYLRFNTILYFFGFLYERVVNSCSLFKGIRVILVGSFEK